jgi:hypothetical protein
VLSVVAAVTALVWGIRILVRFHTGDAVVVQWWHLYAIGNGVLWALAVVLGIIAIAASRVDRSS